MVLTPTLPPDHGMPDRVKTHSRNDFVAYFSTAARFAALASIKAQYLLEFDLDTVKGGEIYALGIFRDRVLTRSATL